MGIMVVNSLLFIAVAFAIAIISVLVFGAIQGLTQKVWNFSKVCYKDGQLQVKVKKRWESYADILSHDATQTILPVLKNLVDDRDRKLLAKIHANHKPEWEYVGAHQQHRRIIIHLECKLCGHKRNFETYEIPTDMRKALITAGVIDGEEDQEESK